MITCRLSTCYRYEFSRHVLALPHIRPTCTSMFTEPTETFSLLLVIKGALVINDLNYNNDNIYWSLLF